MKYIIPEKKVFDVIYHYINDYFYDDNLDWVWDDYDDEESDRRQMVANFTGDKWRENEQDDYYFTYVSKEYYENEPDDVFAKKWIDKAPLLDLLSSNFQERMNGFFGPYWKPVFEKWFSDNYPEFPVKTYIYRNNI